MFIELPSNINRSQNYTIGKFVRFLYLILIISQKLRRTIKDLSFIFGLYSDLIWLNLPGDDGHFSCVFFMGDHHIDSIKNTLLGVGSFHYQILPFPQSQIKLECWISYFPKFLPVLSDYQLLDLYHLDTNTTYFLFFTRKDMFFLKKSIYYTSQLHIYFLKFSFSNYEYGDFQFSK
jgi:hypothetical protein